MKRIDVHCHYVPDFYLAAATTAGRAEPDGIAAMPYWSEADALATMDRLDVRTSFLSISSPGVHFGDDAAARTLARQVNEEGARLARDNPGRFGLFASTPLPDVDGAVAEVRHAFDHLHADGVVLETNFHGVYLGDERLEPLYAELNARRATVFIHPTSPHCPCCAYEQQNQAAATMALGYPRPMLEFIFETTRTVTNMVLSGVLDRHPHINVIVPHAGAALPILAARVELLLPMLSPPGSPALPSLRAGLRQLHFDLAGAPVPEMLSVLLQVADPGHIHYGSDWPFTPAKVCEMLLAAINDTPLLDNALKQKIMHDNAARLFPRLA